MLSDTVASVKRTFVSSCGLGVSMGTEHLLVSDLEVDTALADLSVAPVVRLVWQLLRESDVRLGEAVALDVPDLELAEQLVVLRETREGGVYEAGITFSLAAQLQELIGTRQNGPLFTMDGRRLRADEVANRFRKTTGKSVHALRFTRQVRRHRSKVRPQLIEQSVPAGGAAEPA